MLRIRASGIVLGYFRTPSTGGAYRYLMSKIDPKPLEAVLRNWVAEHARLDDASLEAVAIDGRLFVAPWPNMAEVFNF